MVDVQITTGDIQAVMVEDPSVSLKVQVKAIMRSLEKSEETVTKLTEELDGLKNGKKAKEK